MKRSQVALAVVVLSFGGLFLWRSRHAVPDAPSTDPRSGEGVTTPLVAVPSNDNASANGGSAPKVDIVFALDTTSSMSGLIDGAKQKIWEVARRAQQGQPAPRLRVGMVAYRDIGDAYVTKTFDLSSDMDAVYAFLSGLRAEGGGDGPEHVLKGLHDAVTAEHWSQEPEAVKLVYLVGDAPPHLDYHDGLTMDGVLGEATRSGIRVSAIRCGNDPQTLAVWSDIARRTEGEVSTIEQSGGVAVVKTPYDEELARLNAALTRTEVSFGSATERHAADSARATSLAAPPAAQAERASFYGYAAASKAAPTKKDLAAIPAASVAAIAPADLPEPMQGMSVDERTRFVEAKQAERTAILAQVKEASAKREAYLRSAAPAPAASSFDSKVYDSLKKAGAKKGIAF